MLKLRLTRFAALTLLFSVLNSVGYAVEPTVQMQADTCAMCHGTEGKSAGSIDDLAGLEAEEFIEEMQEFRTENKGRLMAVIAKGYSDAQIREMARYFESLPK